MEKISIHLYKPGAAAPDSKATIPLASLRISLNVLPTQIKAALGRDEIDLKSLDSLLAKNIPKGELLSVESSRGKVILLVD